jgi:uncharacterized protein DUF4055
MNLPTTDISDQGNRPGDGPLRPGGQPSTGPINRDADLPSTPSATVKKQQPALKLVRDLSAGPEKVRAESTTYLPQGPGEDPANYQVRLKRSVFFNVFGHTVKGLVGQVFRRDPKLNDDVPVVIRGEDESDTAPKKEGQWENLDLAGTHGDVLVRDLLQDALTTGHAAVLVEFPTTQGVQNHAAELTQVIRPYWVPIQKDNIVSWRTTIEDGHVLLTQLVLRECTMVPDGMFGEKEQTRYRVLYRESGVVGFKLLQINADKSVTIVEEGLYPTQDEIPVAEIVTSGRTGLFESTPPLVDLAYLNVAHYQQWSDYATSIHKTCVPIFTTTGLDTEGQQLILGPNSAISLPQGCEAAYVSHDGSALNECKVSLDDLKSDMGTVGLSMLSPQKRTAETAQAKRLDKSTEDSALAVTARGLQDGLERALYFHARYLKLDSGGSVTINKQFDQQTMDATMLSAWTSAVAQAGVPPRLMVEAMQVGELIDPDEVVDDIALEMEANAQAAQDAKIQQAQDQATIAQSGNKPGKPGPVDIKYGADGKPSRLEPAA